MIKLFDAQVITLMMIVVNEPPCPEDLRRFPTLQLLLDNKIIENRKGKLVACIVEETMRYQNCFHSAWAPSICKYPTFEELEAQGKILRGDDIEKRYWFWEAAELRKQVELLGGWIPSGFEGAGKIPQDKAKAEECRRLILEFNQRYPFGPFREPDDKYRDRILNVIPSGAVYTAEDLSNASGKELDAIGERHECKRL